MVKLDAKASVNRLKLRLREPDHFFPNPKILHIPSLQFHQLRLGRLPNRRVRSTPRCHVFVQPLHFPQRIRRQRIAIERFFPSHQQHAKLRAPIANVIVRHHHMPDPPRNARHRITKNRRSNVPDMHGLGHIGARKINDQPPRHRPLRPRRPQLFVRQQSLKTRRERLRPQPEINKPRSGHFRLQN